MLYIRHEMMQGGRDIISASYPKHRFKNEVALYITMVSMIVGIQYPEEAGREASALGQICSFH